MAEIEEKEMKAGFIPYFESEGEFYVYLMTPSDKKFGGTNPQIAKGKIDSEENTNEAAIREATEELGLKIDNIKSVQSLGEFSIEDDRYRLVVYFAKVKDPDDFDRPHYETGWTGWLEIEDAINRIRPDQAEILKKLKSLL